MTTIVLALALLCGQTNQELAIALAIAINAPQPEQQSVVAEPVQPVPAVARPAKPAQQYRTETRYRLVRKKFCNGGRCYYRMVREPYTVRVAIGKQAAANWPTYPTQPRASRWHQNGHAVTWQHLLEGEHARHNFDPAWLKSRTRAELEQLHAHSHTGRLDARFIVTRKPRNQ